MLHRALGIPQVLQLLNAAPLPLLQWDGTHSA